MNIYFYSIPEGLEDVSKYPALFDRLYDNRDDEPKWSREDLEKLAGRNLIRVFKEAESVSILYSLCTFIVLDIVLNVIRDGDLTNYKIRQYVTGEDFRVISFKFLFNSIHIR